MKQIIQSLRDYKNQLVNDYYDFRISTPENPYTIALRGNRYKILFILSHMRSGSSLLTHLLTTNPEIIGFGEAHIEYQSQQELKKLILKVYRDTRQLRMNHKYVLDKLLHDKKLIDETMLFSEQIRAIFLIREQKKALASILKLKPHWNENQAIEYYSTRLATLEKYAKLINNKKRSLFITHEQILDNTQSVFQTMQDFLEVKQPFSEEYQVLSMTGTRGIGDSSENIKAGRIVRQHKTSETSISSELIEQGLQSFTQCYTTLSKYCQTVDCL
ncbi:MAG TPA: sulfotransferase family protein [Cyanobacteria bacterium UBA11149]|nr:sulfotransferase family protein [Cyanobacteria bacterium UBA11366]HBK66107.1 sulfotransferase family protein [Cyanobacteria bacterium UBA11166]HBR74231.1 sulfotransferase family protein [Cyanobacteria bacterium UBA11159]HBS70570.1 sulfotransferase family protein [Cyanobacteria bacterium UBA11153]HBW88762.1 sulfotransferase family protein [Cyanobacteria bacterium UBA11149]HCA95743.1 sulfotransferase family protein [Cyanobacteria bacterium UBA9226]